MKFSATWMIALRALRRNPMRSGLTMLGIKLDAAANDVRGKEVIISTADSPIKVMVVPTNEELVIARDTRDIVEKSV